MHITSYSSLSFPLEPKDFKKDATCQFCNISHSRAGQKLVMAIKYICGLYICHRIPKSIMSGSWQLLRKCVFFFLGLSKQKGKQNSFCETFYRVSIIDLFMKHDTMDSVSCLCPPKRQCFLSYIHVLFP